MTAPPARIVAICIATCRRPDGLRALLASLDQMTIDKAVLQPEIYLVDNAPDALAVRTATDAQALSRWPVTYVVEPKPGIVMARNRALDLALSSADLIAFVDDDETVPSDWLTTLTETLDRHDSDAVQGAVSPVFQCTPQGWITDLGIFQEGPFADGTSRHAAATNNVLVRADTILRLGLRFDPDFNTTGGEDEDMFSRLTFAGGRIVNSSGGCVKDIVPAHRMTFGWASRRSFRRGNTLGRIARRRRHDRLLRFAKGFGAMGKGTVMTIMRPTRLSGPVGGWLEICRGAGMIAAFLNLRVVEYGPRLIKRDRQNAPLVKAE